MKWVAVIVVAASFARPVAGQEVPLAIQNARLTQQHTIQCDLVSQAAQPATAWTIQAMERSSDGSLRPTLAQGSDMYNLDALPAPTRGQGTEAQLLRPGQQHHYVLQGPFETIPVLVPLAMVLADGTAFGDSRTIDSIFDRRLADRDASESILADLYDVRTSYRGLGALHEAVARMEREGFSDAAASSRRNVARNLSFGIRRVTGGGQDADAALSVIIEQVEREYQAARNHSVKHVVPLR
jgi:hypothetical protein